MNINKILNSRKIVGILLGCTATVCLIWIAIIFANLGSVGDCVGEKIKDIQETKGSVTVLDWSNAHKECNSPEKEKD